MEVTLATEVALWYSPNPTIHLIHPESLSLAHFHGHRGAKLSMWGEAPFAWTSADSWNLSLLLTTVTLYASGRLGKEIKHCVTPVQGCILRTCLQTQESKFQRQFSGAL